MSITNYINPAELVLAATQEGLTAPDWNVNMQIVDMCNVTPAIAYPVMEALKKRLQSKKASVGLLAVALLEALVKNCVCIHPFVGNREFMELFVKTLPKKVREPGKGKSFFRRDSITNVVEVERIDRTLLLIQSWSSAFARITEYPIFVEIHRELQRAGVHFPEPQKDEGAPVFTPPVNYESPQKKTTIKASQAAASGSLDSKQSFRDRECQVAAEGANLLNEALTASEEGSNLAADDLIQALLVNVRASAGSIFQRIQSGTSSELELEELLRVNDICNNSIAYYQGLIRGTMTRAIFKKQQADAAKQKSGDKKKAKKKKKKDESSEEESEEESDDEEEQKQPQVPNIAGGFVLDAYGNKVATTTPAAAAPWLAEKVKKKGTDYVPSAKSGSKKKKKKDKNVPKLAPPPAVAGKSKASHLTPDAQASSPPMKTATAAPAATASSSVDPLDLLFGNISTPSQPVQPIQQPIQPQVQQQHQPSYTTPFHSSQQALNPFTQPNPYAQQQPPLQHQASNPFFQSQPMVQQPVSFYPGQQQQASMNFFQQQPHPYAAQQQIQQQSHYGQAPFAAQQHIQAQATANPFGGASDPFGSFNTPAKPTPAATKTDDFGQQTAFGAFGFIPLPNRTAPIASQPIQQQQQQQHVDDDPWAALATRDSKPAPKQQAAAPVDDLDDFAKLAMR